MTPELLLDDAKEEVLYEPESLRYRCRHGWVLVKAISPKKSKGEIIFEGDLDLYQMHRIIQIGPGVPWRGPGKENLLPITDLKVGDYVYLGPTAMKHQLEHHKQLFIVDEEGIALVVTGIKKAADG